MIRLKDLDLNPESIKRLLFIPLGRDQAQLDSRRACFAATVSRIYVEHFGFSSSSNPLGKSQTTKCTTDNRPPSNGITPGYINHIGDIRVSPETLVTSVQEAEVYLAEEASLDTGLLAAHAI